MQNIIISKCNKPAYNLALEEKLVDMGKNILYLWINEPSVIIGRNQNPYLECNISKMKEDNIQLVRRRSGGGAVYHDLGNLNFTIISKKDKNNIQDNFRLILDVLKKCGISAEITGRNDIEVDGKKISGSAFYEDKNIFCHHGTLLINVNEENMSKYLTPSKLKLEAKGIKSVKSRVTNLSSINSKITTNSIIKAFCENQKPYVLDESDIYSYIPEIVDRYKSHKWCFGESPEYNVYYEKKLANGIVQLQLLIKDGIIATAKIYSDSLKSTSFSDIESELRGKIFTEDINKYYFQKLEKII